MRKIIGRKATFAMAVSLMVFSALEALSQPGPGDYFREYIWTTPDAEGNSTFLRVGGRFDYRMQPENYPDAKMDKEKIFLDQDIILKNATRAEVCLEKVLCHENTTGLRISFNGNPFRYFAESQHIPEPQDMYMHHFYPVTEISLQDLKSGNNNFFVLDVDTAQAWNWPQNLVYGLILRIYYEAPEYLSEFRVEANQVTDTLVQISMSGSNKKISSIEFVAKYEGIDWDGDGNYNDWHYHYYRGDVRNHIATSGEAGLNAEWDIAWLPDQDKDIQLAARVHFTDGTIGFTNTTSFMPERKYSVLLCKPYDQEQTWVTRNGIRSEKFNVPVDPEKIKEARLHFTSWSPGYLNGIYINDFLVFMREGDRYAFMQHNIGVDYTEAFEKGENTLSTGKTPLHHGHMVHGTEVMWPGIMVLLKVLP